MGPVALTWFLVVVHRLSASLLAACPNPACPADRWAFFILLLWACSLPRFAPQSKQSHEYSRITSPAKKRPPIRSRAFLFLPRGLCARMANYPFTLSARLYLHKRRGNSFKSGTPGIHNSEHATLPALFTWRIARPVMPLSPGTLPYFLAIAPRG